MPLTYSEVVDRPLFSSSPFQWRMGVRSLDDDLWLQPDDARDADLGEKATILETCDDAFMSLPGSEPASLTLRALVATDLERRGLGPVTTETHALADAGRSVQEDLCLIEAVDGQWRMTAGCVCFPTHWSLADKIGRSLSVIHEPVPGYEAQLSAKVDRFFDRMPEGSLAWRLNWSLVDRPDRRLEPNAKDASTVAPEDVGGNIYLRVERQTLRQLVGHEAVVFGIRIHVWTLDEVIDALEASDFAAELTAIPNDVSRYKDLDGLRDAVVDWVGGRARS